MAFISGRKEPDAMISGYHQKTVTGWSRTGPEADLR
jgi:hypothetical protein